jgi:hypothetical protein
MSFTSLFVFFNELDGTTLLTCTPASISLHVPNLTYMGNNRPKPAEKTPLWQAHNLPIEPFSSHHDHPWPPVKQKSTTLPTNYCHCVPPINAY